MSFDIKIAQTSEGPKFVTVVQPYLGTMGLGWFQQPWEAGPHYYHLEESWSGGMEQALTKEDRT